MKPSLRERILITVVIRGLMAGIFACTRAVGRHKWRLYIFLIMLLIFCCEIWEVFNHLESDFEQVVKAGESEEPVLSILVKKI